MARTDAHHTNPGATFVTNSQPDTGQGQAVTITARGDRRPDLLVALREGPPSALGHAIEIGARHLTAQLTTQLVAAVAPRWWCR